MIAFTPAILLLILCHSDICWSLYAPLDSAADDIESHVSSLEAGMEEMKGLLPDIPTK